MVPVSSQSPGIGWETDLLCNFYMTYMAKSYYIRYIKVEKTLKSTSPFSYFFLMWLLENLKWYPVHLIFLLATAVPEIQCLEPCLCLQATMFTKGPQLTCRCPDHLGLPGGSAVKNPPANAGDMGLIPGLRRFPGGGNGNPLQYTCLENPMDRGAWWVTVHGGHKESAMTEHICTSVLTIWVKSKLGQKVNSRGGLKEGRDHSLPPQALQPGPFNLKSHTGGGLGAARLARR